MGQVIFASIVCILISLLTTLLFNTPVINVKNNYKELKVIIPEDLDYSEIFDDIFEEYLNKYELMKVKTIQLGSLIEVTYKIELKDIKKEKSFIDEIRCRNGNLTIVCAKRAVISDEL